MASNSATRYSEALPILYRDNTFHFRGAPGLLAFQSSISTVQWHAVHHIHLSTLYDRAAMFYLQDEVWPPENPLNWEECGRLLCELPSLESLKLDITAQIDARNLDSLLMAALNPLKSANAKVFEVELNVKPSPAVWDRLREANFVTTFRERPENVEAYGTGISLSL